jgi:hypothetical protein
MQRIEMSGFLNKYETRINEREKPDDFEKDVFRELKEADYLICYSTNLNKNGIDNLILPHHATESLPDRQVKVGGDTFHKVISNYHEDYIPNSKFPICVKKIQEQQSHFFGENDPVLKADFLFVSNDREFAHPNHYDNSHGENKIFMGNGFHRLVAYGLWVRQNGFRPLEVYYIENPTL